MRKIIKSIFLIVAVAILLSVLSSCEGSDNKNIQSNKNSYFFYSVSGCVIKNNTPHGVLCDYNRKCDGCGHVEKESIKHCNASKDSDQRKMGTYNCPKCKKSTDVVIGYYKR